MQIQIQLSMRGKRMEKQHADHPWKYNKVESILKSLFLASSEKWKLLRFLTRVPGSGGRGQGLLGLIFAGYVPLASQSPYPIIVYFVASCRPHLSHFWANM